MGPSLWGEWFIAEADGLVIMASVGDMQIWRQPRVTNLTQAAWDENNKPIGGPSPAAQPIELRHITVENSADAEFLNVPEVLVAERIRAALQEARGLVSQGRG